MQSAGLQHVPRELALLALQRERRAKDRPAQAGSCKGAGRPSTGGAATDLQREHLLLDGVRHDQPQHLHPAHLPQPVAPVDRLLLDRGVPPGVHHDHEGGLGRGARRAAAAAAQDMTGKVRESRGMP